MAEGAQSARAIVEIDGQPLPRDLEALLEQVSVDQHLHLTDAFSLVFRDLDRKDLDRAGLRIGSQIRISGTELGGTTPILLLAGEVTTLEADYHPRGARAVARGYDLSHRL